VGLRATDFDASTTFYDTVLRTLGIERTHTADGLVEWDPFCLSPADAERPVTHGLHIGFTAPTREHVHAFWQAGVDAGYRDDGAPGPRPEYGPDYYGGFLLDPDGNSAEAVHHDLVERRGVIDHLWFRVADVAEARAFYLTIAPHAGIELRTDTPERVQFAGAAGSFSLVAGTPTEHVHVAFPAADVATIERFHRAATDAGYRDNGAPGERPEYHAGYHGAFVLDPDGNNVEVVHHDPELVDS
jgi:catechol 2,3-dioxygenase-like lactoylglutathione lyase family enzyme